MDLSVERILGSWKLKEFSLRDDTASDWKSWGTDIRGLLIYALDGYMSASINRNVTTAFDPVKDVLFYAGKFELKGRTIHHEVWVATSPERVNTSMVRDVELIKDELVLSGRLESGREFRLVWVR